MRRKIRLPWHHSDPEADKGAYTQTGDGADNDLYNASESKTYTRMDGVHPLDRAPEVDQKNEVGRVGECGQYRRVWARCGLLLVLDQSLT